MSSPSNSNEMNSTKILCPSTNLFPICIRIIPFSPICLQTNCKIIENDSKYKGICIRSAYYTLQTDWILLHCK